MTRSGRKADVLHAETIAILRNLPLDFVTSAQLRQATNCTTGPDWARFGVVLARLRKAKVLRSNPDRRTRGRYTIDRSQLKND